MFTNLLLTLILIALITPRYPRLAFAHGGSMPPALAWELQRLIAQLQSLLNWRTK